MFVGDAVTVKEPPYVGAADIDNWLESLDVLRSDDMKGYRRVSGRDGRIKRDDINAMARFLRKIPVRLERMAEEEDIELAAEKIAEELIDDFSVSSSRYPLAQLRLQSGLIHLFNRTYPDEE